MERQGSFHYYYGSASKIRLLLCIFAMDGFEILFRSYNE